MNYLNVFKLGTELLNVLQVDHVSAVGNVRQHFINQRMYDMDSTPDELLSSLPEPSVHQQSMPIQDSNEENVKYEKNEAVIWIKLSKDLSTSPTSSKLWRKCFFAVKLLFWRHHSKSSFKASQTALNKLGIYLDEVSKILSEDEVRLLENSWDHTGCLPLLLHIALKQMKMEFFLNVSGLFGPDRYSTCTKEDLKNINNLLI